MDYQKIIVLAVVLFCFLSTTQSCSQYAVNRCASRFASALGVSRQQLEEGIATVDITLACSAYEVFSICMERSTGYCSKPNKAIFQGLEDGYDYVCGEGLEVHLKHQSCLRSNHMETKADRCVNNIYRSLGRNYDKEDVCDLMKDSLDCIERAVDSVCGSEAAEHQRKLERRFLDPIAELIDCDLDEGGMSTAVIVGIVIILLVIVIIFFAVAYYMNKKRRRRRHAEENQTQMSNVVTQPGAMAPGYPGYPATVISSPPSYHEYQDPNVMHATKPPIYDSPAYTVPSNKGIHNPSYTGLPGKE